MNRTVQVLDLNVPANALALWLALNEPTLFLWCYRRVRRARKRAALRSKFGLGAFGQDTFDVDLDDVTDAASDTDDFSSIDEATDSLIGTDVTDVTESPQSTLGLTPVTVSSDADLDDLDPSLLTPDTDSGADTLDDAGDSSGDDGTTIAGCANGAGDTTQSALGQVGSALTSTAALTALAGAAATYFLTNGDSAGAAVTGAQISSVASGNSTLPLATVTSSDGSTSPALVGTAADGSTTYTPITEQDASLLGGSGASVFLSEYGVYIAAFGAAAVLLIAASRRGGRHR